MTSFPGSPLLKKGGIVLINQESSAIELIIPLQYNPHTLTRTLQVKDVGEESGNRSDALRLSGPPVETLKIEVEIDASDQLEFPEDNPQYVNSGIHSHLAALETIIYPTTEQLISNNALARSGTLEIAPMETSLTLFIWGKDRIIPVRITEFSITEEAFDANLNPIRAKVSLGLRVLSVDDLGFEHKGSSIYLGYQQNKEIQASLFSQGTLNNLGIKGIS
jgi:hypothetical protein